MCEFIEQSLIYCGTKKIDNHKPDDDLTNYRFWAMLVFPVTGTDNSVRTSMWGVIGRYSNYATTEAISWYENYIDALSKVVRKSQDYSTLFSRKQNNLILPPSATSELLFLGSSQPNYNKISQMPSWLHDEFSKIIMMETLKNS